MTALQSILPAPTGSLAWCADDGAMLGVRVEALAANPESCTPALLHCVPAFGADTSIVVDWLDAFVGVTVTGLPPAPRTAEEREKRASLAVQIVDALPVSSMNSHRDSDLFLDVTRLEILTQPQQEQA